MIEFDVQKGGLTGVIADLEGMEKRVKEAARRAMNPKRWRRAVLKRAKEILGMLAEGAEEKELAMALAGRATTAFWDDLGMVWGLDAPEERLNVAGAILNAEEAQASGPLMEWGNREEFGRLHELVLAWVRTPEALGGKRKLAPRDTNRTDEEIARGLVEILLGGDGRKEWARAGIWPHLQEFMERSIAGKEIGEEKLGAWLEAVLDGWVEMACDEVVEVVGDEVVKEFRGKKGKN